MFVCYCIEYIITLFCVCLLLHRIHNYIVLFLCRMKRKRQDKPLSPLWKCCKKFLCYFTNHGRQHYGKVHSDSSVQPSDWDPGDHVSGQSNLQLHPDRRALPSQWAVLPPSLAPVPRHVRELTHLCALHRGACHSICVHHRSVWQCHCHIYFHNVSWKREY